MLQRLRQSEMFGKLFIEKANKIHNNKYYYSLINYINSRTKVKIICQEHGIFEQRPNDHLSGKGCPICADKKLSALKTMSTEQFVTRANANHNNCYDYSLVNYTNSQSKVDIICLKHGIFQQIPNSHLRGRGCSKCAIEKDSIRKTNNNEYFIKQAERIHNSKYDYSLVNYISAKTKVDIICLRHGIFTQKADNHLQGYGCPRCGFNVSKKEVLWMDMLKIPIEYRQKIIKINGKNYKFDAFNPLTKTIYEFYGDYWHGNPNKYNPNDINKKCKKTFGRLYEETMKREEILKQCGYKIISVWENEFKEIK
jgi:hypothetical protein